MIGTPSRISSSIVSPMSSPYVTKPTVTMPAISSNTTIAPPTLHASLSSSATTVIDAVKQTDKTGPTTKEERSSEKDQQQHQPQHQRKLSFSSVDKGTNATITTTTTTEPSFNNSMGSLNLKEPPRLSKTLSGGQKPPLSLSSLSTHHDVYPRTTNDTETVANESSISQNVTPVMANHHGLQTT
eukprot:scaffold13648_cov28-Attheya_sp.AAC.1